MRNKCNLEEIRIYLLTLPEYKIHFEARTGANLRVIWQKDGKTIDKILEPFTDEDLIEIFEDLATELIKSLI